MADENYQAIQIIPWIDVDFNEFESLLVEPMLPTRFMNLAYAVQTGIDYDMRFQHFVRVQKKFKKLADLKRGKSPNFVFAHMLAPHTPFVFTQDGKFKTKEQLKLLTREQNYLDQLIYANSQIQALIDNLLARDKKPIIIIQADEGPFPNRYLADEAGFDWHKATDQELRQKFRILNSIYFPNKQYENLYKDMTPVNTFRLIFNQYFGKDFPLLPDTSRSFISHSDLYTLFDVTDETK